jgi:hypothetical protein
MNRTWQELVSAYLDGELSAAQRAEVEQLLVESAEYRRLWSDLRDMQQRLRNLPRLELEDDFAQHVLQRAEFELLSRRETAQSAAAPTVPEAAAATEAAVVDRAAAPDASSLGGAELSRGDSRHTAGLPQGHAPLREHGWIAAAMVLAAGLLLMVAGPWPWPEEPRPLARLTSPAAVPEGAPAAAPWPFRSDKATTAVSRHDAPPAAAVEAPGARSHIAGDAQERSASRAASAPPELTQQPSLDAPRAGDATDTPSPPAAVDNRRRNVEQELQRRSDVQPVRAAVAAGSRNEAADSGLLVVHVEITEDAWQRGEFRQLLAAHQIDWNAAADEEAFGTPQHGAQDEGKQGADRTVGPRGRGTSPTAPNANASESIAAPPDAAAGRAGEESRVAQRPAQGSGSAIPLQVVHVQAAAGQLESVLSELRQRGESSRTYTQVALVPIPDDPLHMAWARHFSFALPRPSTDALPGVPRERESVAQARQAKHYAHDKSDQPQQQEEIDGAVLAQSARHGTLRKNALAQRIDYPNQLRGAQQAGEQAAAPDSPPVPSGEAPRASLQGFAAPVAAASQQGAQPDAASAPSEDTPGGRAVRVLFVFHVVPRQAATGTPSPAAAP